MIRPCDVDTSGPVWCYVPESHKTEHHGRQRRIYIGPKGQDVLRPYLLRDKTAYCFSPQDSEKQRHAEMREHRKTPVQPSQQNRRKAKPKRQPAECYTKDSYCRAVARGVKLANKAAKKAGSEIAADVVKHWHPNQLRHSVATAIRRQYGIEAAQVCLGHSKANTTEIYAERDFALAARIMREVG
jgi:integrase